jgi:hypothetical protein
MFQRLKVTEIQYCDAPLLLLLLLLHIIIPVCRRRLSRAQRQAAAAQCGECNCVHRSPAVSAGILELPKNSSSSRFVPVAMALEADEFVFFDAREAALAPVDEVAVFLLYMIAVCFVFVLLLRLKYLSRNSLLQPSTWFKRKSRSASTPTACPIAHTRLQTAIGTDRAVAMSLSDPPLGSRDANTLNKATTSVIMCDAALCPVHCHFRTLSPRFTRALCAMNDA